MTLNRALGLLFLIQFAVTLGTKIASGVPHDALWVSHVTLVTAGVGLIIGSKLLVSTALVCVFVPHTIWLVDALGLFLLGHAPLSITDYLADADLLAWIGTVHHFYLMPALLVLSVCQKIWHRAALVTATTLIAYLYLVSYCITPRPSNVNYVHGLLSAVRHPWLDAINGLPTERYLPTFIAVTGLTIFLPASIILKHCCGLRRVRLEDQALPNREDSTRINSAKTTSSSPFASTTT